MHCTVSVVILFVTENWEEKNDAFVFLEIETLKFICKFRLKVSIKL